MTRRSNLFTLAVFSSLIVTSLLFGQYRVLDAVRSEVDFSKKIRHWDGFGVNYVQVAQSIEYDADPQEYGGFSVLNEHQRQEIIDMIFGDDGLRPAIVKMFLDPFHQKAPDGEFDHISTTKWMRYFVREGLKKTRARGEELTIITTLYGPPPWATKQKLMRGRDLDPIHKYALANYIINWAKFLREKEAFPVKYISLHNEGEDWMRWPADGKSGNIGTGHDYNLFWPPEQVVDFLKFMRPMLNKEGLEDVGLTCGECSNWYRFGTWGYAYAIAEDKRALRNLGLITCHGFYSGIYGRWFGEHSSAGSDILRTARPQLHAWVTSTSWSKMDADFLKEMHGNIYTAKVNAITPWACVQRPEKWVGGDPNPGTAFRVFEDGTYKVLPGYYYYKQLCRAGQPGMAIAKTYAMDSEVALIGFTRNGTKNPSAFVLVNIGRKDKKVRVKVSGCESNVFNVFRTIDAKERYKYVGKLRLENDSIEYLAPAGSATTFFAK